MNVTPLIVTRRPQMEQRSGVVCADSIESMESGYSAIYNVQPQELTCEYRTFKDGTPQNSIW